MSSVNVQPYHLERLRSICERHPIETKYVVVPSQQVGYDVATGMLRRGFQWLNLRAVTLVGHAESVADPVLAAQGWRRLPLGGDRFLVAPLLESELRRGASPELAGLNAGPGLVRSVAATLRTLRMAGVDPGSLTGLCITGARMQLIAGVYAQYCEVLDERKLYDSALALSRAVDLLPNAMPPGAIVVVFDEAPASGLLGRCLRAMIEGRTTYRVGRPDYGVAVPDTVAGAALDGSSDLAGLDAVHPAGRIRTGSVSQSDGDRLSLRTAIGVEGEVRGVIGDIRRRALPLDEVEIVYAAEMPYASQLANAFDLLGVPASFADGLPVGTTPPGRLAGGFLRWVASDLDVSRLVALFRGGPAVGDRAAMDLVEILDKRAVGVGREAYDGAFLRERQAAAEPGRGTPRGLAADRVTAAEAVLSRLLDLVPSGVEATLRELIESVLAVLAEFSHHRSDADRGAVESMTRRLESLADSLAVSGSPDHLALLLYDLLRDHRTGAEAAREGAVHVVPVEKSGYSGRRYMFCVGLDESSFPGSASEDPLLLDFERSMVSPTLPLRVRRPRDRTWHLVRALGMAAGEVTLVSRRYDLVYGKELYPSPLFEECRQQLGIDEPDEYSLVPDERGALTSTGAWLAQRGRSAYRSGVQSTFPALTRGEHAASMRLSGEVSVFSGFLGRATPELRIGDGEGATSPSALEKLASCPYQYFLRYVLRIRPRDAQVPRPGHWLTPSQFGLLVHEVLCGLMAQVREEGGRFDTARHESFLEALVEDTVASWRALSPPRSEVGYETDLRRLHDALRIFMATETDLPDGEPFELEYGFGRGERSPDRPAPVTVELGPEIRLSLEGSIDRVDGADSVYRIWDYKTGRAGTYSTEDLLSGGTNLQWALYGYVLEELLSNGAAAEVQSSGYYFVSDREPGRRISRPLPERAELGRRLAPLFRMVAEGGFPHYQKARAACPICDFKSVCQDERRDKTDLPSPAQPSDEQTALSATVNEWSIS